MDLELIVAGGEVVDGSAGATPLRADVGVAGGRIAAIGDLSGARCARARRRDRARGDPWLHRRPRALRARAAPRRGGRPIRLAHPGCDQSCHRGRWLRMGIPGRPSTTPRPSGARPRSRTAHRTACRTADPGRLPRDLRGAHPGQHRPVRAPPGDPVRRHGLARGPGHRRRARGPAGDPPHLARRGRLRPVERARLPAGRQHGHRRDRRARARRGGGRRGVRPAPAVRAGRPRGGLSRSRSRSAAAPGCR